jgi:hypothetical protein
MAHALQLQHTWQPGRAENSLQGTGGRRAGGNKACGSQHKPKAQGTARHRNMGEWPGRLLSHGFLAWQRSNEKSKVSNMRRQPFIEAELLGGVVARSETKNETERAMTKKAQAQKKNDEDLFEFDPVSEELGRMAEAIENIEGAIDEISNELRRLVHLLEERKK